VRILIADDDRIAREMLRRTLTGWGFEVTAARDGGAAWEVIAGDRQPSLAIIDWEMPRLDGIELCRRIRSTELRAPLYVILLTGRTGGHNIVAGLEAGADDYLTKPFEPDELRARLHVGRRTLALIGNLKRVTGLLPICSYCKRIRSDVNYWEQVERYITEHSDAQFTHGICPACFDKAMEEVVAPRPPGTGQKAPPTTSG
jgi:DNA-binding response OmpR family regulator